MEEGHGAYVQRLAVNTLIWLNRISDYFLSCGMKYE